MLRKRSLTHPHGITGLCSGNDGQTYWNAQIVGHGWEDARFEVWLRQPKTHKAISLLGSGPLASFQRDLDYNIVQVGRGPFAIGVAPEGTGFIVIATDPQPYPIHKSVRKLPWSSRTVWYSSLPTRSRIIRVRALDIVGDLITETVHDPSL